MEGSQGPIFPHKIKFLLPHSKFVFVRCVVFQDTVEIFMATHARIQDFSYGVGTRHQKTRPAQETGAQIVRHTLRDVDSCGADRSWHGFEDFGQTEATFFGAGSQ